MLPAAIVVLAIALLFGAAPWHFLPVWTDEVVYWNEAAAFSHAGFEAGNITVHEQTPRAAFSRFGAHGPAFAILHGSIGLILGWQPYTAFLINLVVVSLAAFAWLRGSAAGSSRAAIVLLATFWPLLLYLPTNMQEPTHFALAFLFALAIERRIWVVGSPRNVAGESPRHVAGESPRHVEADLQVGLIALLLVASALLRPTWALMILPLGWTRARRAGPLGIALLVVVALAASAAAYGAFGYVASPGYQNNLNRVAEAWTDSPGRAIAMTVERATLNVRLVFARTEDEPPEIALRYFIALFVAVLGIRRVMMRGSSDRALTLETALLALVPLLGVVLIVGEVESWRDFRLIAPHLLVSLLILAARGGWERWLWAATLVALPVYVAGFREFHEERFTASHAPIAEMRAATADVMPFMPGASPWANTVLVHAELLQFPLVGLPRGIGISYVADWENLSETIRSRYVLLRDSDREELGDRVALDPIAETPLGTLYRNAGGQ